MRSRRLLLLACFLGGSLFGGLIASRWHLPPEVKPPPAPQADLEERASIRGLAAARETLSALPYIDGTADPNSAASGVLSWEPARSWPGLNLYCARTLKAALLFGMDGKVVAAWHFPLRGVDHCAVFADGSALGLIQDRALLKVGRDSRVLWTFEAEVHHAFFEAPGGSIYVLARRPLSRPELHPRRRVYDDLVIELGPDGAARREISLLGALLKSPYRFLLPVVTALDPAPRAAGAEPIFDLLHANEIAVFDGRLAGRSPLFAAGNLLVSLRNLSALAILDSMGERVLWLWGPSNLAYQHHPSLLPDGKILLFNNRTEASELLEIDPLSFAIGWRYAPGPEFFSATRGSCQRLPNGNTLVTESNKGYAFELTPAGEKVWVWANPVLLEDGKRAFVWRVTRYDPSELPFLSASSNGASKGVGVTSPPPSQ